MTGVVIVEPNKSKFFDIFFRNLPYPFASGLVRGIKAFLSIVVPATLALFLDGSILKEISVIPTGYVPLITAVLSPILLGVDKWFRENGLIEDVKNLPTSQGVSDPVIGSTRVATQSDVPLPDQPIIPEIRNEN